MTIILLTASLLPPLYLLWRIYQIDKIEREPVRLLTNIFILGMLSTLPASLLEGIGQYALGSVLGAMSPQGEISSGAVLLYRLLFYFIVVGGAEEFVKYQAMKIPTWRNPEFNYVFDGVVYGVTSALGFAALENVLYVMDTGIITAGVRAWTAIPLHCIAGIFMGHFYGIAKAADLWGETAIRNKMLRRSIVIPMLIHGAYDFIATSESEILAGIFFVYIIIMDIVALRAVARYAGNDVRMY